MSFSRAYELRRVRLAVCAMPRAPCRVRSAACAVPCTLREHGPCSAHCVSGRRVVCHSTAIWSIGFPIERRFGFWRTGSLYVLSGIFGTIVSLVFLPAVLSVGASASVFGLVGACWADVVLNYCARGTLRGSNIIGLFLATALNIVVGLTPWVDNFMHLGGLTSGLMIGLALFGKKAADARTGERRYSLVQESVALLAALLLIGVTIGTAVAVSSSDVRTQFRRCSFCELINCVPMQWWSCCLTQLSGSCALERTPASNGTYVVTASCNMTGLPPFGSACSSSMDPWCSYTPGDREAAGALCARMCNSC